MYKNEENINWSDYRLELERLFFSSKDVVQKNSSEYEEFWKFLQKYENVKLKKKTLNSADIPEKSSKLKNRLEYSKEKSINFKLNRKSIEELESRRDPVDFDNDVKRLSIEKLEEFKLILHLYLNFAQKQKFNKVKTIRKAQKNLPIHEYKSEILETVAKNSVTIIAGDTGCGKSTQIPQYLLEFGFENIACTQPRRIACIALSKRVSYETLNEFGSKIGYQIRFESRKTDATKIVFLTEGLILRQIAVDPLLSQYNVIILDEIHERHLQTDFLLGVVKCLSIQRPSIKVILMSATINIDLFSNYFMNNVPVIKIPGRLFPIETKYFPIGILERDKKGQKIDPSPYIRVLNLIDKDYPSDERGDVLIFMSGMKEITTVLDAAKIYAQQSNKWVVLPLHSTISLSEQEKVFDMPPEGVRKCIISTNIAETSITIDGVRFVMDSGKVKEMSYDPVVKMQKLKEFWISQASAEQRKGRSGRTGPGVCFRLYSADQYSEFNAYTTPEIMRVPLDTILLQMISMGLPDVKLFPFIEPPPPEALDGSLDTLKSHSAITEDQELTPIGKLLAQLPLDIALGKMLIMSALFDKIGPVIALAASLSVQSPFTNNAYRDPDCRDLNKEFTSNHGDPFTVLNVYREWLYLKTHNTSSESRKWCKKRGLEEQRFYEITKLSQQFMKLLLDSGLLRSSKDEEMKRLSSSERAKRYGELAQLNKMRKELNQMGPRRAQVLKVDMDGGASDWTQNDTVDAAEELRDIDFKIRYDKTQMRKLYYDAEIRSFKDMIMVKALVAGGLYPNVAIPDEYNTYKSGSEQLFHTQTKPYAGMHPNSVFSDEPDLLKLTQPDIVEGLPGFTGRFPVSSRHQIISFLSILETDKSFLINPFRIQSVQTLMLFSMQIDTDSDISTLVFDQFFQVRFPDQIIAQNMLDMAVLLRKKWKVLLESRVKMCHSLSQCDRTSNQSADLENNLEYEETIRLQKDLVEGLIQFYLMEPLHTIKRLLAADVKVLYRGPCAEDFMNMENPFSGLISENSFKSLGSNVHKNISNSQSSVPTDLSNAETTVSQKFKFCEPDSEKGGLQLTDYLTYNCLLIMDSNCTILSSFEAPCPYCDEIRTDTTLERLIHMKKCRSEKGLVDFKSKKRKRKSNDFRNNEKCDKKSREFDYKQKCDIEKSSQFGNDKKVVCKKSNATDPEDSQSDSCSDSEEKTNKKIKYYCQICDKHLKFYSTKDIFHHKKCHL